jgi:hypothetical protein
VSFGKMKGVHPDLGTGKVEYKFKCPKSGCDGRRKFTSKPRMSGGVRCRKCNTPMKKED